MPTTRKRLRRHMASYAMIAPFFVLFGVFSLAPMIYGLAMSLADWNGIHATAFVGLHNFTRVVRSPFFVKSIANLGVYVALTVPIGITCSLGLALLVDRFTGRTANFLRNAYFLPTIVPLFLAATVWRWILTPDFGIVNVLIGLLGIHSVDFLADPKYMIPAVMIVDLWRALGYNMVILLAGLKSVPSEFYDAAQVDGASVWRQVRHIAIPQIEPVLFLVIVAAFISDIQVFDVPWLMSKSEFRAYGGPLQGMLFPVMDIMGRAFGALAFGEGAAYAFLLLVLILLVTWAQFAVRKRRGA